MITSKIYVCRYIEKIVIDQFSSPGQGVLSKDPAFASIKEIT